MVNDTPVTVVGWLGADPTLSSVTGGQQVANFRVASTVRRLRDGTWESGPTSWFAVKTWGRLAEHCASSLRSGQPVVVHGRLTAESWQREDGTPASRTVVVATSVGHDLARGTSAFTPLDRSGDPPAESPGVAGSPDAPGGAEERAA